MNIGILLDPYGEKAPSGLGRSAFEVAKHVVESDTQHHFTLYVRHAPETLPAISGTNWHLKVLNKNSLWLSGGRNLDREQDAYMFLTSVVPLLFFPKRAIVTALDFAYLEIPSGSFRGWLHARALYCLHAISFAKAKKIACISEETRQSLMRHFHIPKQKTIVIPFSAVDLVADPEPIEVPKHFFLYAGVLKERKNVKNIIRAFSLFAERDTQDYDLCIAGRTKGEYYESLVALVREFGIENRVHFLGYVTDGQLRYLYQHATALVFPSLKEGFGMPVLEAMREGLPVITSNKGALAEVAGDAALLVTPESIHEIAVAMMQVSSDADLREALALRGETQAKRFSWEIAAKTYLSMLSSISAVVLAIVPTLSRRSGAGRQSYETFSRVSGSLPLRIISEDAETADTKLPISRTLERKKAFLSVAKNCLRARRAARGTFAVHAFDAWPYGVYGLAAVLGTKRRLIINGIGTYSVSALGSGLKGSLVRYAYRRASVVPCNSQYTKKVIDSKIAGINTTVVPLGSTVLPSVTDDAARAMRTRLAIPTDAYPIVLTVGEIKERKGQKDTLAGIIASRALFPKICYLVVGSAQQTMYVNQLREMADAAEIRSSLVIASDIRSDEDLAACYALAHIFALNSNNQESHFEGFGLVFLEAAQFGLPGIGSKDCGIEDAISDNISGVLVPQKDPQAFASAVSRIMPEYKRFSDGARQWYTRFSWDETARQTIELYKLPSK